MASRGGATPFRSSEGLSTRQVGNSDDIQLRIDSMHSDLDNEISGLSSQVRRLKNLQELNYHASGSMEDLPLNRGISDEQPLDVRTVLDLSLQMYGCRVIQKLQEQLNVGPDPEEDDHTVEPVA